MFKENTEKGELSEGYILGQPFLRAFVVVLNYEKNTIGFANKQKAYASEILGKDAPGPKRSYYEPKEYQEVDEDKDFIPVDETGQPTDDYVPWSPKQRNTSEEAEHEKEMKILNIGVWSLVIVLAVCLGCKYRKDK